MRTPSAEPDVVVKFPVWLEFDRDDGVWVTHVPALGDLSTFGPTREIAIERTREAIRGYIVAARREGLELPSHDLTPIETEVLTVAV